MHLFQDFGYNPERKPQKCGFFFYLKGLSNFIYTTKIQKIALNNNNYSHKSVQSSRENSHEFIKY